MSIPSSEIRKKFLDFFKSKGHAIVPSSSLIPDDPSVLLTTAGMQQFKKYYTGELDAMRDFRSKSTASVQKCFRTGDIDEVGDESHLTFFEMLGNFSFGGYFKKEAIEYAHEFITSKDWMGLNIEYITVFDPAQVPAGDWRKNGVPRDEESEKIWKSLDSKLDVRKEGVDVFWGPTGSEGPCGPTTEIYVKNADGDASKPIEIWNIVFNQYYCDKERKLTPLDVPGIDTGMGLERLTMVVQKKKTIFETDLFREPFRYLAMQDRNERIIADHVRAATFLLADGVRPSNKDSGYILRRLIRRAMVYSRKAVIGENALLISKETFFDFFKSVIRHYGDFYRELKKDEKEFWGALEEEFDKFNLTLERGLREFDKRWRGMQVQDYDPKKPMEIFDIGQQVGSEAFDLYQSYGFPVEVIKELLRERLYDFDENAFKQKIEEEFKKHQKISRAGLEKKFGGHGLILDTGELKAGSEEELIKVTRLHTATHLLQQALRDVLGPEVQQRGSDITTERTRFDFTFGRKMTDEEKKKVEEIANQKVGEALPVSFAELPYEEAVNTGALHFFKQKYPATVKVYYVGNDLKSAYSKEFCGGPHVKNTSEIGRIRIAKEEASSAGVRRIRATVE